MFENPTVNLIALCNSCAKIACFSSELIFTFLYAGSSMQNERQQFFSCNHVSFLNFALHPTPQTKIYRIREEGDEKCTPDSNSSKSLINYFIPTNALHYFSVFLVPIYFSALLVPSLGVSSRVHNLQCIQFWMH
jgi:hypothetical protein